MPKIISCALQKGGVGKTTTTQNLAAALAEQGRNVLAIDLDPQGNLTQCHGYSVELENLTIYEALIDRTVDINDTVVDMGKYRLIPSKIQLSAAEIELNTRIGKESILNNRLMRLTGDFDYIIIDCPPNLGNLTINAVYASDMVIIPFECSYLSYMGLEILRDQLIDPIESLRATNIKTIILPTMYDCRTKISKQMLEQVEEDYDNGKGYVVLPWQVKLATAYKQAALAGKDIFEYQGDNDSLLDVYRNIAKYIKDWSDDIGVQGRV
jgi:chromosome partitioning protein